MNHLCRIVYSEGRRRVLRFGNPKDHAAISEGISHEGEWFRSRKKGITAGHGQCDMTNIHPCGEVKKAVGWREPLELETGATMCSELGSFTGSTVAPSDYPSECKS